jgi:hypothetical protein
MLVRHLLLRLGTRVLVRVGGPAGEQASERGLGSGSAYSRYFKQIAEAVVLPPAQVAQSTLNRF